MKQSKLKKRKVLMGILKTYYGVNMSPTDATEIINIILETQSEKPKFVKNGTELKTIYDEKLLLAQKLGYKNLADALHDLGINEFNKKFNGKTL